MAISFHNVNFTLPYDPTPPVPGGIRSTTIIFPDGVTEELSKGVSGEITNIFSEHSKPTAGFSRHPDNNFYFLVSIDSEPPLKQFKSGIAAKDIACREGLQLVIKSRDGSPACVKPTSVKRFIELGYIHHFNNVLEEIPTNSQSNKINIESLNHFPNISNREINVTIGENYLPDYDLPVTIQDKIIREKPSEVVMFQKIGIESDVSRTVPQDIFIVTDDKNQTDITNSIPDEISLDVMVAGPNKETLGFYFPVEIPLKSTAKTDVIIFNYSDNLILPNHDKTYHIKLTSFSPVNINLPQSAIILENNTRSYTEFWYYVRDDNAYSYKTNLFDVFYGYQTPSIKINQVIVYEIAFKLKS